MLTGFRELSGGARQQKESIELVLEFLSEMKQFIYRTIQSRHRRTPTVIMAEYKAEMSVFGECTIFRE